MYIQPNDRVYPRDKTVHAKSRQADLGYLQNRSFAAICIFDCDVLFHDSTPCVRSDSPRAPVVSQV